MNGALDPLAIRALAAGVLSLSLGAAPLGVLLVSRRMSLVGDAMSHAILPGVAIAALLAGTDPLWLTLGALIAAVFVAGAASLLARAGTIPEDAAVAVFYLPALALGVLLIGRETGDRLLHELLFGDEQPLGPQVLILAASAATATLFGLALFIRGFVGVGADPVFMRSAGAPAQGLNLLFMALVALNLVAGFRAFGALMTVGLMMLPALAARFWARGYVAQAAAAVGLCMAASATGLLAAALTGVDSGPAMVLAAAALFAVSAVAGRHHGLLQNLPGRAHLEG